MPLSCSAFGCSNHNAKESCQRAGISFHRFPLSDESLLKQWLLNIKRANFVPNESSKVCSEHFEETCFTYQNFTNRRLLKKDAAPTKFTFVQEGSNIKRNGFVDVNPVKFPKDKSLCTAWARATRREGTEKGSFWMPSSESTYLCSNHFLPTDFEVSQVTRRLREDVIPSVFNFDINKIPRPRKTYSPRKDSVKKLDQQENRNMEYISCSIPGCKSKSHRKRDSSATVREENILMFPVPHADELFNKWKAALKRTNTELTKDDHICEYHFLESDIQRYHKTKTPDGDIIKIQKRLPALKSHAIPIKCLKPFHKTESSKKLSVLQNPDVINSEKCISDKQSVAFNSCDSGSNAINIEIEILEDSSVENCTDSSVNSLQGQISHKKKCMPYNELVKNIQRVKKPSMFWSVVCTDQFTVFARWNNKFVTEKRLVIESSLTIRVFLKEWEIEMTDLVDITSVEDVSSLLEKVENYKMDLTC